MVKYGSFILRDVYNWIFNLGPQINEITSKEIAFVLCLLWLAEGMV